MISYKPCRRYPSRMELVNRAERIRWRAFHIEARKGNYSGYHRLVALSREAHLIRIGE